VIVTANAVASVGTPAGSATLTTLPDATREPEPRVSSRRLGVRVLNRPAVAGPATVVNAPVTSTITCAADDT
jgi:hypothetical protein